MGTSSKIDPDELHKLPDRAGVYCCIGPHRELLYVGKSVNIRRRVQDHFRNPGETTRQHRLYKNTVDINVHLTPGEFGATVLELHYIKKHRPILNVQSRQKGERTIAIQKTSEGYLYPELAETNDITTDQLDELLAIFTSRKQARGRIEELAEEHELCARRLQLNTSREDGPCFDYQVGNCRGACVGEEPPDVYNQRFREAFQEHGVKPWPHEGAVEVVESKDDEQLMLVIEDWCLVEARQTRNGSSEPVLKDSPLTDGFNYDLYKRLAHFLLKQEESELEIRTTDSGSFDS